jgi:hypothetical protein
MPFLLSRTGPSTIHHCGTEPPPGWLSKFPLKETFRFRERPVSRFWLGAELAQVTTQMIHL